MSDTFTAGQQSCPAYSELRVRQSSVWLCCKEQFFNRLCRQTRACHDLFLVCAGCAPNSSTTCGAKTSPSTCCSCEQDDHTQDLCGPLNCPANSTCTYMGNKVNAVSFLYAHCAAYIQVYTLSFTFADM